MPMRASPIVCLILMSSFVSAGCATSAVIRTAQGIDWPDPGTLPPQTRVVADAIAFCARGDIEIQGRAFPAPDLQWSGGRAPVPVVHSAWFGPLGSPRSRAPRVQRIDAGTGACDARAGCTRVALEPADWRVRAAAPCAGHGSVVKTIALDGRQSALLQFAPAASAPGRALEITLLPDPRPEVARREARPLAYALLPLALPADALGVANTALVTVVYEQAPILLVVLLPLYLPFYLLEDLVRAQPNA